MMTTIRRLSLLTSLCVAGCISSATGNELCENAGMDCRRDGDMLVEIEFAEDLFEQNPDLQPMQEGLLWVRFVRVRTLRQWQSSVSLEPVTSGVDISDSGAVNIVLIPGEVQTFVVRSGLPTYGCAEIFFFRENRWGRGVITVASSQCVAVPSILETEGEAAAERLVDETIGTDARRLWPEPVRFVMDQVGPREVLSWDGDIVDLPYRTLGVEWVPP